MCHYLNLIHNKYGKFQGERAKFFDKLNQKKKKRNFILVFFFIILLN